MKKLSPALGVLLSVLLGACMNHPSDHMIGMPNPYTWHESVEEAARAAELPFVAPAVPEKCRVHSIASASINGALAQIRYTRSLDGGGTSDLLYRISRRMEEGADMTRKITRFSGDYTPYPETGKLEVDGLTLFTRGHDGLICVAYWEDAYSRVISDSHGLTAEEVRQLVRSLK